MKQNNYSNHHKWLSAVLLCAGLLLVPMGAMAGTPKNNAPKKKVHSKITIDTNVTPQFSIQIVGPAVKGSDGPADTDFPTMTNGELKLVDDDEQYDNTKHFADLLDKNTIANAAIKRIDNVSSFINDASNVSEENGFMYSNRNMTFYPGTWLFTGESSSPTKCVLYAYVDFVDGTKEAKHFRFVQDGNYKVTYGKYNGKDKETMPRSNYFSMMSRYEQMGDTPSDIKVGDDDLLWTGPAGRYLVTFYGDLQFTNESGNEASTYKSAKQIRINADGPFAYSIERKVPMQNMADIRIKNYDGQVGFVEENSRKLNGITYTYGTTFSFGKADELDELYYVPEKGWGKNPFNENGGSLDCDGNYKLDMFFVTDVKTQDNKVVATMRRVNRDGNGYTDTDGRPYYTAAMSLGDLLTPNMGVIFLSNETADNNPHDVRLKMDDGYVLSTFFKGDENYKPTADYGGRVNEFLKFYEAYGDQEGDFYNTFAQDDEENAVVGDPIVYHYAVDSDDSEPSIETPISGPDDTGSTFGTPIPNLLQALPGSKDMQFDQDGNYNYLFGYYAKKSDVDDWSHMTGDYQDPAKLLPYWLGFWRCADGPAKSSDYMAYLPLDKNSYSAVEPESYYSVGNLLGWDSTGATVSSAKPNELPHIELVADVLTPSTPTGITTLPETKQADAATAKAYYTLQGQRLSKPAQRGIYIHDGKKIVVK